MKFFIIIRLLTLKKAIESTLDIEASQKIKVRKKDQTYMMNTIKELYHKIYIL